MRKVVLAIAIFAFAVTLGARHVVAQEHDHGQAEHPQAQDGKATPEPEKRDPNRPKPENQPGTVMNAEELAASHVSHHKLTTYADGGVLPKGWEYRFDLPDMKLENVRFVTTGTGLHVTCGPPGIYYEPAMTARGSYTASATFTQVGKNEHPEGYGAFVGGADLDQEGQRYTYFLLRQDGKYLIKQRVGAKTTGVMDWTDNKAVKPYGDDGRMTNTLSITVDTDSVRFLINGTEVDRRPRTDVDADGIVGLRVNHDLDLMIEGFGVAAAPLQ